MKLVFAAYSRRFLTTQLDHSLPQSISRSGARSIRVLWYMREMGGGWVSFRDLSQIGAGQYKSLQYAIPDLLKDELINQVQLTRKNGRADFRYKINSSGLKILKSAEKHVENEYQKAAQRACEFRKKWDIKASGITDYNEII